MPKPTLKCGRNTFELKQGDTVLDNGHCFQLVTRKIWKRYDRYPPEVSKAEFKKFISLPNVKLRDGTKDLKYYVYIEDEQAWLDEQETDRLFTLLRESFQHPTGNIFTLGQLRQAVQVLGLEEKE